MVLSFYCFFDLACDYFSQAPLSAVPTAITISITSHADAILCSLILNLIFVYATCTPILIIDVSLLEDNIHPNRLNLQLSFLLLEFHSII